MSQGFTKAITLDTDGTLAANSDALVPSQKAVKTYVDTGLATKQDILDNYYGIHYPNARSGDYY